MPTRPNQPHDVSADGFRTKALTELRKGTNPFAMQVASVGTADYSVQAGVADFSANQLAELLEIIELYRDSRPPTRVYPVLGDRGSGKTHLLHVLRGELRHRSTQSSEETMVVVVDRLSSGMEPVDYLLWQIVNHLMNQKGDGERMLGVIAGRLTARLLAEGLRRLAPPQRVELIPPAGWWDSLCLRFGSAQRTRERLEGIERIIETCDSKSPTSEEIRDACNSARFPFSGVMQVIEKHLERSEPNDVLGWFRRSLYLRLAKFAILKDRDPFEELHAGDYEQAPANVQNAGNLSRRLLEIWLELLLALGIPVIVIFDQLEDYLRSANAEQAKENQKFFTGATANFINELRHVCILVFAEQTQWSDLMNNAEPFAAERLRQPYALAGRPSKYHILMPEKMTPEIVTKVVQHRIRTNFPSLDLTGLSPSFPFSDTDVSQLCSEPSIRLTLRRLAKRYDELVFTLKPKIDLRQKLLDLWKERIVATENEYISDTMFKVSFIPEMQNALQGWLDCLEANGVMGPVPWKRTEMLTDPSKQPYGNLCIVRIEGPHAPGIGIAAWLGKKRAQSMDLAQRIGFFKLNPCPIRTLVMLRADGENALVGETKATFVKAINANRDIRIQKYEPRHLHALMAFSSWHQSALAEVDSASESDPNALAVFHDFLAGLSKELLSWIDAWRQPVNPPSAE